ncbi:ABC transporter permease [Demequina sp. SO4-13]|uniref:ABC transporter permease n=1 Tax=Demequina sp. SO4-13 TaxID=3401027 RepID=UPI003AF84AB4
MPEGPVAVPESTVIDGPDREEKSYSQGQLVRRRFFRHKGAMVALGVLLFVTLLAFTSIGFGPIPGWWGKNFTDTGPILDGGRPTIGWFTLGEHPFGQDQTGRDFFALTMRGTQISLTIAFIVGIVSTIIGTIIGAIAGFFRGWAEAFLMRMTDLFIIIPLLVLAAVLGRIAGDQGIVVLSLTLAAVTWTSLARLVRGEVLSLREREFVMAARAIGTGSARIIARHILPNTVGVIIVATTFAIAAAILLETALSFLGFGVQPPDISLGSLIDRYQTAFTSRPWLFWFPGMFILAIALSVNFIGDGLRDAFDPRQNKDGR